MNHERNRNRAEQDAARGIELAKRAIHAIADGDETQARAHLNSASYSETVWAAGYLLVALRSAVLLLAGGDTAEASRLLHDGANETEDVVLTQAALIVNAAFEREGLGS